MEALSEGQAWPSHKKRCREGVVGQASYPSTSPRLFPHPVIHHQMAANSRMPKGSFCFTELQAIQAMQATMILSTIFCCIAFFVFIHQLFRLKQGERFVLTSIIQLCSCESLPFAPLPNLQLGKLPANGLLRGGPTCSQSLFPELVHLSPSIPVSH